MAGMGTRDIKRKIKSVNSTMQITKAMELVSTAKLKRAQDRMERTKPYYEAIYKTVHELMKTEKNLKHSLLVEKHVENMLYIVITGDRGLCGGYNTNVIKATESIMIAKDKSQFMTVGKRARDYFVKRDFKVIKEIMGASENPQYSHARDMIRTAIELYKNHEVDGICLVYTKMINTITQEVCIKDLLPLVSEETLVTLESRQLTNYEPSPEVVLDFVIPKYLESVVYGAMVEAAAAEQAARRLAMESASDNADEMIQDLVLSFNQARQAAITQELSEIVGGAEALK